MKDQLGAVSQGASELGEKTSKMGVRLTVKLLASYVSNWRELAKFVLA